MERIIEAALVKRDQMWEGRVRELEKQIKFLMEQQLQSQQKAGSSGGSKAAASKQAGKPQRLCFVCKGTTNVHKHRGEQRQKPSP